MCAPLWRRSRSVASVLPQRPCLSCIVSETSPDCILSYMGVCLNVTELALCEVPADVTGQSSQVVPLQDWVRNWMTHRSTQWADLGRTRRSSTPRARSLFRQPRTTTMRRKPWKRRRRLPRWAATNSPQSRLQWQRPPSTRPRWAARRPPWAHCSGKVFVLSVQVTAHNCLWLTHLGIDLCNDEQVLLL